MAARQGDLYRQATFLGQTHQVQLASDQVQLGSDQVQLGSDQVQLGSDQVQLGTSATTTVQVPGSYWNTIVNVILPPDQTFSPSGLRQTLNL